MNRVLAMVIALSLMGCSGAKSANDEAHFKRSIVPKLKANLVAISPLLTEVVWSGGADRTEQDGLAPIPRTTGHSYIVLGTMGTTDVVLEGEYEPKNRDLVFAKTRVTFHGRWNGEEFPSNAFLELGFSPDFVAAFSGRRLDGNSASAEYGGQDYDVQVMSSSYDVDDKGVHNVVVTSFELMKYEAIKR